MTVSELVAKADDAHVEVTVHLRLKSTPETIALFNVIETMWRCTAELCVRLEALHNSTKVTPGAEGAE